MDIPPELLRQTKRYLTWPIDDKGFFNKLDGTHYNPTESQGGFVTSNAVFSAFIGGRGCVAPETLINGVPIAERRDVGLVRTLNGQQLASPGYLKGVAPLYHLQTESGSEVLVTEYHRILTPFGWRRLNQVQVGDLILSDGTWHVETGKEIKSNSLDYYSFCFHLYDELHTLSEGAVLGILQQSHKPASYNNAWPVSFLLSTVDFLAPQLCRLFLEYSTSSISYEQLLHQFQDFFQSRLFPPLIHSDELWLSYQDKSFSDEQSASLSGHSTLSYISWPSLSRSAHLGVASLRRRLRLDFLLVVERLLRDLSFEVFQVLSSLPPSNEYNYNAFFDKIESISYVRDGEYYDLSVPVQEHYSAQGLFHHNSGKTCAGAQKALIKISQGENGAVLNPDFENFRISTWPEFREWIPWDLVTPKQQYRKEESWQPQQPFRMTFKNGVSVICKGLKNPDSARGPNINWLWYDEGGVDLDGLSWRVAVASVRKGVRPQAWVTTTPRGIDHWIHDLFVDKKIPEDAMEAYEKLIEINEEERRGFVEIYYGSIYDNEKNLNPMFMSQMLATYPSGWLREQELSGKFVNPAGSLGDRSWFDGMKLPYPPEVVKKRIRYWDLAATEKKVVKGKVVNDPDESVGTLMSVLDSGEFVIEHQTGGFLEWDGLLRSIRDTSIRDGVDVKIIVEEEPGSGGKNQVAAISKYLKDSIIGHPGCDGWKPPQDRVSLANIWFGEAKQKRVFYVDDGSWGTERFLSQLDSFPDVKHDDLVTSVTGARMNVSPFKKWKEIEFLSL